MDKKTLVNDVDRWLKNRARSKHPIDFAALMPSSTTSDYYDLYVAARWMDDLSPAEAISDVLSTFESVAAPSTTSYQSVYRVVPVHTSDPWVSSIVSRSSGKWEPYYESAIRDKWGEKRDTVVFRPKVVSPGVGKISVKGHAPKIKVEPSDKHQDRK